jgi:hypothetical protein
MFQTDLDFGRKYEKKLLKYIEYDTFELAPNIKFLEYDVKINHKGEEILFEVKADKLAHKTGNFCIEYECNNKPSGIETTKADYYAYFIIGEKTELYIIPTSSIKRKIKKMLFHKKINGGDGYRSCMYLFKMDLFQKYKF